MATELLVSTLFLSSPSDLGEERQVAAQVQNRINSEFGLARGRLLHVVMWENAGPSYGRTQDGLNVLVDSCDLFVGVLHERWGTPTGEFTSGFEEEFHRVSARREQTGSPEIAMFFKAPTQAKVDEPDEAFRRILDFKETWSQKLTYKSFSDLRTWELEIGYLMTKLVLGDFDAAAAVAAAQADAGIRSKASDDDLVRNRLAALMRGLPEKEQIALALRYVERLSDEQVAVVLGESLDEVRSLMELTLRSVHDELMGDDPGAVRRLWESMQQDGATDD